MTSHRATTARGPLLWTTLGAISFVAAAGIGALALDLGRAQTCAALVGASLVSGAAAVLQVRRRTLALRRLERGAARMLLATPPASADPPAPADPDDPGAPDIPAELAPLAGALSGLGERMRDQVRETAKKSRNLEALIDAMDEPLLATDSEDRVLLCSRSAEALIDVPPGGLIGRPIRDLFTNAELLAMHHAAREGQTRRARVRVTTALGQRTYQVSASPVPAAWGEGVFGAVISLRDVTELDQAVQVKTDFVANASHELRTPVAAIRGAAETLQSAADDPQMAEKLRAMIVAHAQRLEEMLRDLLDLSRLESPDVAVAIADIDLHEIVRTLQVMFEEPCRQRGLSLAFEFDDDLSGLQTDRRLLLLILRNLIENATKFAYEGTTVRIVGTLVEAQVGRDAAPDGAGVIRIEVIDKGVGIPLAHQERVFERYYQVDPARSGSTRRGTGLGLAIVKHAVKRLGGRIGISSVWGQGTTVFAELPVAFAPRSDQARQAG